MKNSKDQVIVCISISALLFVCPLRIDAQQVEIGVRYNPEFTGLLNKNDNNAGSALALTSNFGYFSFGAGVVVNFNNNLGTAVDLLFSREGQRFKGNFNGTPSDAAIYSSVVSTQLSQNNTRSES